MRKADGIIFDMDGTLYPFDNGTAQTFGVSEFGSRIHANILTFFQEEFGLDESTALAWYTDFSHRYNGEVSLGLEQEHSIPRGTYFGATWDIDPANFIQPEQKTIQTIGELTVQRGILSAAPDIWVDRVLRHLEVRHLFEPAIFSGEPDIRKPDPQAFQQVADFWKINPERIVAIGDQEHTDIAPAQQVGMLTLKISSNADTAADFVAPDIAQALTLLQEKEII